MPVHDGRKRKVRKSSQAFFARQVEGVFYGESMKANLDIKSVIIGALLSTTIFLGVAATPANRPASKDKDAPGNQKPEKHVWDNKQEWIITVGKPPNPNLLTINQREYRKEKQRWDDARIGAEPFATQGVNYIFRKRVR